ncbi:RDD family protein [Actinorugispora endophytica]|uniref:Putative RDD family membrane protein YckC n=1 Tax=Actinorugispora endophytica TaxID=1605990 RepID=A0A4R6UVL9_9ACTN|nr:RDD family protein [Actinorugispora endophytica]TDQ47554.1 putative RDD family membrane protein YckC [Actinorugispora endophytica]
MNDTPAAGAVPAPLTRRVLARLVDVLVLAGISLLVNAALVPLAPGEPPAPGGGGVFGVVAAVLTFAAYLAYEVGLTLAHGGTPGKRLLGLRLAPVAAGEDRPGAAAVLRRSAVLYASVLLAPVPLVNVVALGVSVFAVVSAVMDRPAGRGLHDRLGGSVVVGERPESVSS